jgi:hypothetical protein
MIMVNSRNIAQDEARQRGLLFGRSIFPGANGKFSWYVGTRVQLEKAGAIDFLSPHWAACHHCGHLVPAEGVTLSVDDVDLTGAGRSRCSDTACVSDAFCDANGETPNGKKVE